MREREAVFHEPRWSWASKDNDDRNAYMAMDGRVPLTDLIAHLEQVAPGVPLGEIGINFGTVTWSRPATAAELADRAQLDAAQRARQEEWERKTLARLSEKYSEEMSSRMRPGT